MQKIKNNLKVQSIYVEPTRINIKPYRYSINNNENLHLATKDETYSLISQFFKNQSKKLILINKLLSKFDTFEVDTNTQKIYLWTPDFKKASNNILKELHKQKITPKDFFKNRKKKKDIHFFS